MPRQGDSLNAERFNHAYFTSKTDAEWVISKMAQLYDLSGKTVLEPCVGAGIFVESSKGSGLKWKTNELFPEHGRGFEPDFQEDFLTADLTKFGTFDFVISNPPFGRGSVLAKNFILRSFELTDVVAMVLPKGLRKPSWLDKRVPRDIKIVIDEDLPDSNFLLPDGSHKNVGCFFLVLERQEGYDRGEILPPNPRGYRFEVGEHSWPDWATHATCMWGASSGRIVTKKDRERCWLQTGFFKFTPKQRKSIPDDLIVKDVLRKMTSVRGISRQEIFALLNPILGDS